MSSYGSGDVNDPEENNLEGLDGQINVLIQSGKFPDKKLKHLKEDELMYTNDTVILRGVELTPSQKDAFEYLSRKKADEFLAFLMAHILTKVPDEPYSFIINLLDRCLEFRDNDGEPPLLFDPQHQEIVYRAMDPGNTGKITYEQYCNGMKTMGIQNYMKNPPRTSDNMITRKDFLEEADKNLIDNLWEMLCPRKRSKDEAEIIIAKSSTSNVSSEFTLSSSNVLRTPSMTSEEVGHKTSVPN